MEGPGGGDMPEAGEQLLDDLMRLRPESLTANAWAVKAGVSRTIWADIRRHGNPSRRTLQRLLAAADSSLAEFEALRVDSPATVHAGASPAQLSDIARPWRQAPLPPLPVLDTRPGGEWGEAGSEIELISIRTDRVTDRLVCPAGLAADPDAYAVTVIGDSMWPRYRPGKRVAVSPAAPIGIGDDVLVILGPDGKGGQRALLKEIVRRTAASMQLRQFNPDTIFAVATDQIEAIHKVAGELF